MFTGIVEEVGVVAGLRGHLLRVQARDVMEDLRLGDSIAVNGACLTVVSKNDEGFSVDLSPETLRRTSFSNLMEGNVVNLERPLAATARLGGHIVQGHVDGTGVIASIDLDGDALLVRIETSVSIMRYIVEKGFVSVDGASLTVVNCDPKGFMFTLIPYTRANTVFRSRTVGDVVNIEIDVIAKYVEKLLSNS